MSREAKPMIVVVEDETELANLISLNLEEAGMMTMTYNNAAAAMRFLKKNFANLLLLDLGLPDQDGFSLMESLKKSDIEVPTIFVTGNHSELNIIKGLEIGGDDYITKPFSFPELIARINAVLRRTETMKDHKITKNASLAEEPFEFCGARVNPHRLEIQYPNGEIKSIGRKELGILQYLFSNQSVVLSRKSLIHAVWGVHADVRSRSLDQYIVKTRDALTKGGSDLGPFRTIHGVGYIYDPADRSDEGKEEKVGNTATPRKN
jgi:DNA-binding response OmpR family regulator